MARRVRLAALALVLVAAFVAPSVSSAAVTPKALGNQLVNRFFADLQRHDVADLQRFLAPTFQIQRADGSRATKAQYLRNLPTIRSFRIRGLTATSDGTVLVATYEVSSNQVINGKQQKTGFAPRLSVFERGAKGWQLLAHANFNVPA